MAEIIKVRSISDSMIYEIPSVFVDFNNNGIPVSENDEYFENSGYKYTINSFISFPDRRFVYGYEIRNVEDFVNDPDSLKVIGVNDTFEYKGFKGSLKDIVIKYLKDSGAITE
ncbi:hypothetical protein QUW13_01895 [Enterococcus hirae]|nr:hypothetical protein [Enterococcus hirae]